MISDDISQVGSHGPRTGHFKVPGRDPLHTPCFLGSSSRGMVPHLTPDLLRENDSIDGLYVALEDFVGPILNGNCPVHDCPALEQESALRNFISAPKNSFVALGPRRTPPLPCPIPNCADGIAIATSFGISILDHEQYTRAVLAFKPDVAIGLADIGSGHMQGRRQLQRMAERTETWVEHLVKAVGKPNKKAPRKPAIFAPILPVDSDVQAPYIHFLEQKAASLDIQGLALYDKASTRLTSSTLRDLPRLYLGDLKRPLDILNAVAQGIDIFSISFLNEMTDSGLALNISFGIKSPMTSTLRTPIYLDLWSDSFAMDVEPLCDQCSCYGCTIHHRAYIHHLLKAKEMLAWVLLQVHNYHNMATLFQDIRTSIEDGSFQEQRQAFESHYDQDLNITSGRGPRIRGYQFNSMGKGETKKNVAPWKPPRSKVSKRTDNSSKSQALNASEVDVDLSSLMGEMET